MASVIAVFALTGCASSGGERGRSADCEKTETHAQHERRVLNEGYSMLRKDARTLSTVKLLLYIKIEQAFFEDYVDAVSAYGKALQDKLDGLPERFPAVRVDLDPLPEIEKSKRLATGVDRFFEVAPVVGKSGRAFERTLLISLSNGLNQERHLVEKMAERESDAALGELLRGEQRRMDALYERSQQLLEQHYYR